MKALYPSVALRSQHGMTIISAVLSLVIVSIAALYFLDGIRKNAQEVGKSQARVIATYYVAELTELFRSFTNTQLNAFLFGSPNRLLGGAVPLCQHINVLNRTNMSIVNPDPIGDLPKNNPLALLSEPGSVNRYYQVEVVMRSPYNPFPRPVVELPPIILSPIQLIDS